MILHTHPPNTLVREIMTPVVSTVSPVDSIADAAQRMEAMGVGSLPVCDGTRPIGVVTDRDIAMRAVANQLDPTTTLVSEVCTLEAVCCFPEDTVGKAAELMERHRVRRLIVVGRDQSVVGILSLGDVALNAADKDLAGEVLERVSEGPATS